MYVWSKPASFQVFKHTQMWKEDSPSLVLHTGHRMMVSGQICLRDTDKAFDITDVEVTDLPEDVTVETYYADYIVYNDGVPYPDIVSNKETAHVAMNTTQSIWLCFQIGDDAAVTTHTITIKIKTTLEDRTVRWKLTVYPVSLPDAKDSSFGHEYFLNPFLGFYSDKHCENPPLEPYYHHLRYDEGWWDYMSNYAKVLGKMRVNSLHIPSMVLLADSGSKRVSNTEWHLDFSLFDRFVEHFLSVGSFRYITICAIVDAVDGKAIQAIDENGRWTRFDIFTPEADAWAKAFYSGIYEHCKEKGWLSMLQMRLQDEPHASKYWKWAREKCREYMPNVVCGEPLDMHTISRELCDYVDQYIPRLEVYEEGADFYLERQRAGDQIWCYSCCYPFEMGWMNKFIDLPPIYSRLIKWACFTHGITGFLHWGFNCWDGLLYGMHPDARFKGDGFIVYPDVEHNSLLLSARGINTIEGLQDWELLNILSKTNATAAKAICRRVASAFNDLHADAYELEAARVEILTLLS